MLSIAGNPGNSNHLAQRFGQEPAKTGSMAPKPGRWLRVHGKMGKKKAARQGRMWMGGVIIGIS